MLHMLQCYTACNGRQCLTQLSVFVNSVLLAAASVVDAALLQDARSIVMYCVCVVHCRGILFRRAPQNLQNMFGNVRTCDTSMFRCLDFYSAELILKSFAVS